MGFTEVLKALARRWYVLALGLALTVGGGWFVYQQTPPDYTARSLVLLLPPVATGEEIGANPFLELGGLELTARVLVATYSGTAFQDDIAGRSPNAEVTVSMDESTQGGVVAVDVKDLGAQETMELLSYVTGTVSQRLGELQSEVDVADQDAVRSMLLAQDTDAKPDSQALVRVMVIVVGAGIAASVFLAVLVDFGLARRASRLKLNPLEKRRGGSAPSLDDVDEVPLDDEVDVEPDAAGGDAVIIRQQVSPPARTRQDRSLRGAAARHNPS